MCRQGGGMPEWAVWHTLWQAAPSVSQELGCLFCSDSSEAWKLPHFGPPFPEAQVSNTWSSEASLMTPRGSHKSTRHGQVCRPCQLRPLLAEAAAPLLGCPWPCIPGSRSVSSHKLTSAQAKLPSCERTSAPLVLWVAGFLETSPCRLCAESPGTAVGTCSQPWPELLPSCLSQTECRTSSLELQSWGAQGVSHFVQVHAKLQA